MVRNAESLIGKFHGIPVYKTNMIEYVNNRYYKDEENMYLIDGELIYKNEIFAKYDGNYVSELDAHLRREFYTIPAIKVRAPEELSTSSIGMDEGDMVSKNEMKNSFQPEDVTDVLTSVYDTDYFANVTDIDAFLKSNS